MQRACTHALSRTPARPPRWSHPCLAPAPPALPLPLQRHASGRTVAQSQRGHCGDGHACCKEASLHGARLAPRCETQHAWRRGRREKAWENGARAAVAPGGRRTTSQLRHAGSQDRARSRQRLPYESSVRSSLPACFRRVSVKHIPGAALRARCVQGLVRASLCRKRGMDVGQYNVRRSRHKARGDESS